MKREHIFLPLDFREEELVTMAHAVGCFVRHVDHMTILDRVPGVVRADPPANVLALRKAKK